MHILFNSYQYLLSYYASTDVLSTLPIGKLCLAT